jgi:hypothetical protein
MAATSAHPLNTVVTDETLIVMGSAPVSPASAVTAENRIMSDPHGPDVAALIQDARKEESTLRANVVWSHRRLEGVPYHEGELLRMANLLNQLAAALEASASPGWQPTQYPGLKRVCLCWKCHAEASKGEYCPACGAYNAEGK